ncbi:MAG: L-serine ammonia-lyase, iron-sulfur-dependent, subunit alpha [Desulfarculales bacterium]|jgi:L-cysteine desulfidase|nr:L-serine ammonia-lyase, iron-sulfur-dependent, subunit alpha [Desulfarculales bacterium]
MNTHFWPQFKSALKGGVLAAIGCTEPISLALASAIAARELGKTVERIEAWVAPNLMKNGLGVTVPGTGMQGLPIAAAAGALGGNPEAGLEVLKHIPSEALALGKKMLEEKKVTVNMANVRNIMYAEAVVHAGEDWVRVCIADSHTHVMLIERNGQTLFSEPPGTPGHSEIHPMDSTVRLRDIYDFADGVPYEEIRREEAIAVVSDTLSKEGLRRHYGLGIGRAYAEQVEKGLLGNDPLSQLIIRSAAASDARMGGAVLPAVSNSGSGNQGITASMPVVVFSELLKADTEQTTRAMVLSHLTALYIHSNFDSLCGLCALVTAGMGAAMGACRLLGGGYEAGARAICTMAGGPVGMVCDGAANSCAVKVVTAVSTAYTAVLLAMHGLRVSGSEGIVSEDVDRTISNVASLAMGSFKQVDKQILEIMLTKKT